MNRNGIEMEIGRGIELESRENGLNGRGGSADNAWFIWLYQFGGIPGVRGPQFA